MPVATFDTLKSSKALREAGVPERQADAQVAILAEAFSLNLKEVATKDDLTALKTELKAEFKSDLAALKAEVKADITALRTDLAHLEERIGHRFQEAEQRRKADHDALAAKQASDMVLVKWMFGAIVTAAIGVVVRVYVFPGR